MLHVFSAHTDVTLSFKQLTFIDTTRTSHTNRGIRHKAKFSLFMHELPQ